MAAPRRKKKTIGDYDIEIFERRPNEEYALVIWNRLKGGRAFDKGEYPNWVSAENAARDWISQNSNKFSEKFRPGIQRDSFQ